MKRLLGSLVLVSGLFSAPLHAQALGPAPCMAFDGAAQERCAVVVQALESGQPQLGLVVAGGNPTLGAATAGGLRLGVLPRVSATGKANLVLMRLPEIRAEQPGVAGRLAEAVGVPAPALAGTLTVGLFPGISVAPLIGGIGGIDAIATGTWLPLSTLGVGGFEAGSDRVSYGFGARLGLLRESFLLPGASVSLVRHRTGDTRFANACPGGPLAQVPQPGGPFTYEACAGAGDLGEFEMDLTTWSTRAVVSKRLLGIGLAGGVGYDRHSSDATYAFRLPPGTVPAQEHVVARSPAVSVENSRFSYFVNGSYTAILVTMAAEAGWAPGGDPIGAFPRGGGAFDPRRGTFFGSFGVRVAL